jgi:hypothetical protein
VKPDPLAYDEACQPLLQKYMIADKSNGRRFIPAEAYGGLKGGKARTAKLTPEQCKEIARKAALARWAK